MQTQEGDKSCGRGLCRRESDKWTIYRRLRSVELFHITLHQTVVMKTAGRAAPSKTAHVQFTAMTHENSSRLSAGCACAPRGKQWSRRLVPDAAGRTAAVNAFLCLRAVFTFLLQTHLELLWDLRPPPENDDLVSLIHSKFKLR